MNRIALLCAVASLSGLVGCTTTPVKPASDLSGAGFILESPNAWSKANLIEHDRELAIAIGVNRAACMKASLCKK
jgi:hypothetical protein